jgi:Na+-transporting methylmalonyl-CoA/oxaloacetate decarboxylase gamma subunit
MSIQNIIDGNGVGISIVGILVVFTGLFLIFLFISSLPSFLRRVDGLFSKLGIESHGHGAPDKPTTAKKTVDKVSKTEPAASPDSELAAVVAYVIAAELEHEALSDYTKITIRRDDSQQVWGVAGKMRTLANRKINFSK